MPGVLAGDQVADRLKLTSAWRLKAVAAIVVVLTAGALAVGLVFQHKADAAGNRDSQRIDASQVAAKSVAQLFSYDYRTIAKSLPGRLQLLTPQFASSYRKLVTTSVEPAALSGKITTRTDVAATAVIGIEGNDVELLMFLNQTSAKQGSNVPVLTGSRVIVHMQRVSGSWLVASVVPV